MKTTKIEITCTHEGLAPSQILHVATKAIENPRAVYLPGFSAVATKSETAEAGHESSTTFIKIIIRPEDFIIIRPEDFIVV